MGRDFWPQLIQDNLLMGIISPDKLEAYSSNPFTKELYQSYVKYDNPILQLIELKDHY
jgi:hypothetical protein